MNNTKKIHLHIVDDEIDFQTIFKLIYKKEIHSNQLELSFSQSGIQCLKYLEENSVDYVLTDINMPEMNGLELIKNLNELYPDLKIFICSAYHHEQYENEMKKLKFLNFITKPLNFDKFKKSIGL